MSHDLIRCPLCGWTHEVPTLDPRIDQATLAGVFGPGIMLQHAVNARAQQIEEAIDAHLRMHSTVEWLRKVMALQAENDLLRLEAQTNHDTIVAGRAPSGEDGI